MTVVAAPSAGAADPPSRRPPPTAEEFARLEREVREQKQLIFQLMQIEQQRYDMLLKLIQSDSRAALPAPELGPPARTAGRVRPAPALPALPPSTVPAARIGAPGPAERTATVSGRVRFDGGSLERTHVYVNNVKSPAARGRTAEIKQKDRRFSPDVLVVPRGTAVSFPNLDAIYHNVFSPSETQPFDLGTFRAGDPVRHVVLTKPGVIDVYCNMHARMHASILVVPGPHHAQVGSDGKFQLEGVPVGQREIVVWSPDARPLTLAVQVGPNGAEVNATLIAAPRPSHLNKLGHPYAPYSE